MTRQLRRTNRCNGLILANGGVLSYQHAICLSSQAPKEGSPYPDNKSSSTVITDPIPLVDLEAEGQATIEVSEPAIGAVQHSFPVC
jgi:hypothetical protein